MSNRALAALDLAMRGEPVRATFQIAYMTDDEKRLFAATCQRLAHATWEILPMLQEERDELMRCGAGEARETEEL